MFRKRKRGKLDRTKLGEKDRKRKNTTETRREKDELSLILPATKATVCYRKKPRFDQNVRTSHSKIAWRLVVIYPFRISTTAPPPHDGPNDPLRLFLLSPTPVSFTPFDSTLNANYETLFGQIKL